MITILIMPDNDYTYQCGYRVWTSVATYIILIVLICLEGCSIFLFFSVKKRKLCLVIAVVLSCFTPVGLGYLVYQQSHDIHSGKQNCSAIAKTFGEDVKCHFGMFIGSPIILGFGCLVSVCFFFVNDLILIDVR